MNSELNISLNTEASYIERLRQLIAEAPDGIDVGPLETALASAEAAMAAAATTGDPSPDRTKIWFLLDRSGSMGPLTDDVIGGFNQFLAEQQAQAGKARISVVLFDAQNPYEVVVDGRRISEVPPLTSGIYSARSMTPLFDAMGTLLERADQRITQRAEAGRDAEDQLVLVFTDGHENASTRFDRARIFEMIKERQDAGNWTFVFMGANQDSYAAGGDVGFDRGSIQDFDATPASVHASFMEFSRGTASYRNKPRQSRVMDRHDFFEGQKLAERALREQEEAQTQN